MTYTILKPTEGLPIVVATVKPTGTQTRRAMGEDVVDMTFESPVPVALELGNTVEVHGRTYKLNRPATVTKRGSRIYHYEAQFEAVFYDLAKVQLRGLGATNQLTESEFTIMANAATMVDLIVQNANRLLDGYEIGIVDVTEMQNFVFNGENCLQALNRIAEAFQSEFWIDNQVIHFQRREQSSGLVLSYGKGNGLYELSRGRKNGADLVTRLYVEGGNRNLPQGYGKTRLQLPVSKRPYLEEPGAEETIEATQIFDNIIPERIGTLTGVNAADIFEFSDTSLEFDINDHLAGGVAKIGFQTGTLAGYEFEIESYNHATNTFKILLKTDEKAYPEGLPNDTLKPAVGDQYALFDIQLPASYVTDAESRLEAAGQAYLDKYSQVQYEYGASLTPLWVKQTSPSITLGYTVELEDTALGIDKEIRIGGYVRDLQEPNTYDLELTDTIEVAEIVRQYAQQERILYAIQTAGLLDPELMRKNLFLNRLSEREGYLYLGPDKVKAGYADLTAHAEIADVAIYALDSDRWDGYQFADYLNQGVRTTDSPRFAGTGSPLFVSGFSGSGWRVVAENGDVHATFDKLTVRKEMNVYELIINQIRATNGSVWVSDAIKIFSVSTSGSDYVCSIDTDGNTIGVPFVVNDIIRCQRWTGRNVKYYVARVTAIGSGTFTVTKLDGGGVPEAGDDVVRMGNTTNVARQGAIYLTASDNNAPYIDVIDGVTSASLVNKVKVRMGKLDGIVDPDMGALSGYGLYGQNVYLRGRIEVTGGNAATRAYAEGQASAAQSAAISTAASDATSKANNARTQAVSTAATDATTKANNAQAAAISAAQTYANNIAQSKADIAEAAAIQAASNDATAKANNARTQAEQLAQQLVDSVAIGAVNLLINSTFNSWMSSWPSTNFSSEAPQPDKPNSRIGRVLYSGPATNSPRFNNNRVYVPEVGEYTLSFDVFCTDLDAWDGSSAFAVRAYDAADGGLTIITSLFSKANYVSQGLVSGQWTRVSFTLTAEFPGSWLAIGPYISGTQVDVRYREIKFEKGSKATGWSPAPEDVQAAIDAADAKAVAAQNAYNNLTVALKGMAYKDIVQLADLGTTVISGGKIVTTLLDAAYIRSNIVNAGYINTLELNAAIIKSGTIDSARINASQIISNGNGATQSYAQSAANAAQSAAIAAASADASSKASNAQVAAINTASADAIAKANAALAAARAYTDTRMNLVANPAVTGSDVGWTNATGAADILFGNDSILALYSITNGNATVTSDWFDVDPGKIYEVTIWIRAASTGNTVYFGAHASEQTSGNDTSLSLDRISDDGVLLTSTNNAYFVSGNADVIPDFIKMTAYILPAGFNPGDANGIGENITYHLRMKPTTKRIRIRWLNWNNGGVTRTVYVANPSVTEVSAQNLRSIRQARDSAASADAKAVSAQTAHNALTASLKNMAYKDVVALADLNSTVISGGKIVTTLLDVAYIRANIISAGLIQANEINVSNLFAQTVTATNLTVSGNSKLAGFDISGNSIVSRTQDASLRFEALLSGSYVRINENLTSPLVALRTDQAARTALMISTYATGTNGLHIVNNASGGTGRAIRSYGSHDFVQRVGESWNAPGLLAYGRIAFNGLLEESWSISSITISSSKPSSFRVTHGLGHTGYHVMLVASTGSGAITTKATSYFEFNASIGSGGTVDFIIIGRNRV